MFYCFERDQGQEQGQGWMWRRIQNRSLDSNYALASWSLVWIRFGFGTGQEGCVRVRAIVRMH